MNEHLPVVFVPTFIMDPHVYDAIDLVSEMEGGLIRGTPYMNDDRCGCMIGAAHFAGVYGDEDDSPLRGRNTSAYNGHERNSHLTPTYCAFDAAHRELSPASSYERLPWTEIAKVMGVVRGTGR